MRAVAYAHSRLIIHRDIKPGNILVTPDGQPKLLDFGVSKLIEGEQSAVEQTALTQVAGRPLTLPYAAPEQLRGSSVTVSFDIYALGVVLFELMTGARLYRSTTPYALEQEILAGDLRRPSDAASDRRRAHELRGDLDAIILNALKGQPEERYASAAALADDIERYLAGQPVEARPYSFSYRLRKFAARHRLTVGAAVSIVLALGTGAGVALWQASVAREQATEATALSTFVLSLIQRADPGASRETKDADLATLTAIEERIDEFRGTPAQKLRLLVTLGDAYRNRGESSAARRAYTRAAEQAVGAVASDDLRLLTAHVRAAHPNLIESMDALPRLDFAIQVLRPRERVGADLLIDALLTQHELANDFGIPEFPPLARRFDLLGEALDVAERNFGRGSRQYLKVLLPYAYLVDQAGDRTNARNLVEASLLEAQRRTDNVVASNEYREVEAAHFAYLCGAGRAAEGLAGLWRAHDAVHSARPESSVQLEAIYSALGLCYERVFDTTGYWLHGAALAVAAARERPPSMQVMRRAARAMVWAMDFRKYEAAEDYYRQAIENAPTNLDPVLREKLTRSVAMDEVCVLYYRGHAEEAEKAATPILRALEREPNPRVSFAEIRMTKCLSYAQRENGRYDEAARTAQALIDRCGGYAESFPCRNRGLLALALARLDAGNPADALSIFDERRKLPLRPDLNPESALGRGRSLLELGQNDEALRWLQAVYGYWLSSHTPWSVYAAESEYWLGQAYLATGDRRGHWMVAEARRTLAASPLGSHRALASQEGSVSFAPSRSRRSGHPPKPVPGTAQDPPTPWAQESVSRR